jgi:thiamine biosynthesis protein ThiI
MPHSARPRVVLIHYGELALKGHNRRDFEQRVEYTVRLALRGLEVQTHRLYGRLLVTEKTPGALANDADILERLSHVYGISTVGCGFEIGNTYAEIERDVLDSLEGTTVKTFAVRTHRVNKEFPMMSEEVNRQLGGAILQRYGGTVNLTKPELEVRVIISHDGNFVASHWQKGRGGLPVGVSGTVLSLLSSGIDSPVASHRMLKRGAQVVYLHFHSYPITSRASIDNVKDIVTVLQKYQPQSRLVLIPFADAQKQIVTGAPSALRVVLYRRLMFQIAESLAKRYGAQALVTGESLGQVASQTIENMTATGSDVALPIFRPLIGNDKEEIMNEARTIGTYDISIRPYEDCCSLLTPKRVATRASLEEVRRIQASLPWQQMIDSTLAQIEEFPV